MPTRAPRVLVDGSDTPMRCHGHVLRPEGRHVLRIRCGRVRRCMRNGLRPRFDVSRLAPSQVCALGDPRPGPGRSRDLGVDQRRAGALAAGRVAGCAERLRRCAGGSVRVACAGAHHGGLSRRALWRGAERAAALSRGLRALPRAEGRDAVDVSGHRRWLLGGATTPAAGPWSLHGTSCAGRGCRPGGCGARSSAARASRWCLSIMRGVGRSGGTSFSPPQEAKRASRRTGLPAAGRFAGRHATCP